MVASDVLPSGGSLAAQLSPSGCATTVWLPPAFWLPSGGLVRRWPALWQRCMPFNCFLAARSAGAGGTLALSFGCFLAAFWWLARPGPARPSTLAALRVAFWLLRPAQPASAGLSPDSLAAFWRHRSWRLPSCCLTLWWPSVVCGFLWRPSGGLPFRRPSGRTVRPGGGQPDGGRTGIPNSVGCRWDGPPVASRRVNT